MNQLTLGEAVDQIQHHALTTNDDLNKIPGFLGQKFCEKARVAQSVIIRSEGILFGISIPRFAIRVYLNDGGFINCRRLKTFIENVHYDGVIEWGNRYSPGAIADSQRNPDLEGSQNEHRSLAEILKSQSCIGDSLLREPDRLKPYGFQYVDISAARLFDAYGEPKPSRKGKSSFTPYIKSVDLGGGLCAQAVCFMATAALANYASKICGISEITAFAHEDHCLELSLSGLTPEKMQRYFTKVNLRLSEQAAAPGIRKILKEFQKREFYTALRCYLRSNIPVILPVSPRTLFAGKVNSNNPCNIPSSHIDPKAAHAVVLFGFATKMDDFVFNDPATFPFIRAAGEDLAEAGCLLDEQTALVDNGLFMPVTPKDVQMPLLWNRKREKDIVSSGLGLLTISRYFHVNSGEELPIKTNFTSFKTPFILSCQPLLESDLNDIPVESRPLVAKEIEKCFEKFHEKSNKGALNWIWHEIHTNGVWLWDAQQAPPDKLPDDDDECLKMCGRFLRAVVYIKYEGEFPVVEAVLFDDSVV
jgi:hypothetical protein